MRKQDLPFLTRLHLVINTLRVSVSFTGTGHPIKILKKTNKNKCSNQTNMNTKNFTIQCTHRNVSTYPLQGRMTKVTPHAGCMHQPA